MISRVQCLLLFGLALWSSSSEAQSDFFRLKADFSIKEKEAGQEQGRLIMGTIRYDKNLHKTGYLIRFPEPEQWLLRDTIMYRIKADSLISQQKVPPVGELSIFNLILSQELQDFGLSNVGYTPGKVQQEGTQVLSHWLPPEALKSYLGPVTLSQEQKRLTAAAFYAKDNQLLSRFYFQDYTVHSGLPVPGKIYQIYYRESGEFVRLMTLKNILINQTDEEHTYDFDLPAGG